MIASKPKPATSSGGPTAFLPLIGRESEALLLHDAILRRESLLLGGPPGVGKTALVLKVVGELPSDITGSTFYLSGVDGLNPLLCSLLERLYAAENLPLRRQLHSEGIRESTFKNWLRHQSSSRLKGALYRAFEKGTYWIFLDHCPPLSHAVAKVVRELVWMRNTPVYLVARGFTQEDIGHVTNLYWSERQRLVLGSLSEAASRELLESCIRRFGLANMDLGGFREEILKLSGRNPGAIVKMCSLASEPRYHFGSRIKTKILHIDYLIDTRGSDVLADKNQGKPGA